ncbi:CpsD/CapB family tyrosine-protein kinase [Desulfotomaculum defluvii]
MFNKRLVVLENPKSPVAEAYRIARTNIQFAAVDKDLRTILITSSGPAEGKSTTAANLGIAFAQSGKSVIIVDADLRKPTQHKVWENDNSIGLTNILLGDTGIPKALQTSPMKNLHIITTGPIPPNPAELLGSQRMTNLLTSFQEYADIIIIDTPPVIAVTDAALVAPQVDGVVLVVASGQAKIEAAQRSKQMLLNGKAKILGTILNMVEEDSQDYYYYYYYGEGSGGKKKGKKGSSKAACL